MLKELEEWHKEELADQQKYIDMSNKAPDEYKSIFMDIAREEASHAVLLEAIIKDHKKHCPDSEMTNEDTNHEENKETAHEENESHEENSNGTVTTEAVKNLFNIK